MDSTLVDATASHAELKRTFEAFLNVEDPASKPALALKSMVAALNQRLVVNLNELREVAGPLASKVVATPIETIPVLEAALTSVVEGIDPSYYSKVAEKRHALADGASVKSTRLFLGFEGNLGANQVNPRTLTADHLTRLVSVEGIVTRCSVVRPKVVRSVHFCPTTGKFEEREYRDATDMAGLPTGSVYPTKDSDGNLLETEFGLSTYKDSQSFSIQEMPESAPLGQLPRSVDVFVENDLVDQVKPGDRVQVFGVYRALASSTAVLSGLFRTVLLANSVRVLSKDSVRVRFQPGDIANFRKESSRPDWFDLVARSVAPFIYGHRYIKQAVALQLLGGREHNLANGTHIRGDINVLMVGDPSTAKSQLLRAVLNLAPLAINTTGRGSSGVGLTAAVTTDPDTGERRLEAGAMVLADRGVVCIDEFDKMNDADRVAIHEVMEQQTVTIAKAGIQASLNARCSVIAAANPIYGRFDNSLPLHRNVALPDSLLSRFDLLFIVRDVINEKTDSVLADHVLRMHRYVKPGQEGIPVPLDATLDRDAAVAEDRAADDDSATPMYQRFNPLLHGGAAADAVETAAAAAGAPGAGRPRKGGVELLTLEFLRKFFHYAKNKHAPPKLSDRARARIVNYYNDIRQKSSGRSTVVTARSLETLIRLSTAVTKCRLGLEVEERDVERAFAIVRYALYGDTEERERDGPRNVADKTHGRQGRDNGGRRGPGGGGQGGDDGDSDHNDDDDDGGSGQHRSRGRGRGQGRAVDADRDMDAPEQGVDGYDSDDVYERTTGGGKHSGDGKRKRTQAAEDEEDGDDGFNKSRGKRRHAAPGLAQRAAMHLRGQASAEDTPDATALLDEFGDAELDEPDAPQRSSQSVLSRLRRAGRSGDDGGDPQQSQDGDDDNDNDNTQPRARASDIEHGAPVDTSSSAFQAFTGAVARFFVRRQDGAATVDEVQEGLAAAGMNIAPSDTRRFLLALARENRVMISDDIVYKI